MACKDSCVGVISNLMRDRRSGGGAREARLWVMAGGGARRRVGRDCNGVLGGEEAPGDGNETGTRHMGKGGPTHERQLNDRGSGLEKRSPSRKWMLASQALVSRSVMRSQVEPQHN
ncbi:hypothetical protein E2C01_081545 [Portunus trituberculatus]|uniref:Uncharacterized protein n=1 Tax=Portunus trituberculatus TaxID=210409 RepID=A0A5B7IWX2_PORTR|nr:hypothetical protein [Portunus trituberculatus]